MPFVPLRDEASLQDALERSHDEPILLFKHSNRCSLSAMANDEMKQLSTQHDAPIYRVVVQEARPVSNTIENQLGVRHETPQVLLVDRGKAVFNASHRDVKATAVLDELNTVAQ